MTTPASPAASSSTMDVARALAALCREGKNDEAIDRLYADDVVSVEAGAAPGMDDREVRGIDGVRGKGKWWSDNHEIHDAKVGGPWPHDDRFIMTFTYDITNKPSGQRFVMEEAALFTVKDGKIAREEFFYSTGG